MKKTFSSGGIVVNKEGFVLVVNQNGDSWSLPKGHIDAGEDAITAAKREIQEESGIKNLTFEKKIGVYERCKIALGGKKEDTSEMKKITIFLFSTKDMGLNPKDPANPEARWVKKEDVAKLLTHPKDKEFFLEHMREI